ncbi:hypothetical protein BGX38DRAFT_1265772 [Terfezia claveryi]|nr:hypothetical protein BGX38DRAFT_1265772 [Terfezia claveryi]
MDSPSPMSSPSRAGPQRTRRLSYTGQKSYKKSTASVKDLCVDIVFYAAPASIIDLPWDNGSPLLKPASKGPIEITMDLSPDASKNHPDAQKNSADARKNSQGTEVWYCCACLTRRNAFELAGPFIEEMYGRCLECQHEKCPRCPGELTK